MFVGGEIYRAFTWLVVARVQWLLVMFTSEWKICPRLVGARARRAAGELDERLLRNVKLIKCSLDRRLEINRAPSSSSSAPASVRAAPHQQRPMTNDAATCVAARCSPAASRGAPCEPTDTLGKDN